jgi:hypothetical protein
VSYFAGIDYDSRGIYVVLVDEEDGAFCEQATWRLDIGPRDEDSFDRARRRDRSLWVGVES